MHRFFAAVALLAFASLAGCDQYGEMTAPGGQARMRLINVSPDAPALSLVVDNEEVHSNVNFPGVSDYAVIAATRTAQLIVAQTGGSGIAALTVTPAAGSDYATVVFGVFPQRAVATLRSENLPAPAGQARLRVVHTATTLTSVDIYITAPQADIDMLDPTFSARNFANVTAYLELEAGTVRLRATNAGEKDVLIDASGLQLATGANYTAFLIESPGGSEPLAAFLVQDSGG